VQSWDEYFMRLAHHAATRSKDQSTQVGCVIVGPDNEIRSTGYNSFPRGINDHMPERQERPEKYLFFEHAERNSIYNAARCGTPLKGCRIYLPWLPCMDCARGIVQVGIIEVVVESREPLNPRWKDQFGKALTLFSEAGVKVRFLE
jgi:dCMP deaminase